MDRPSASETPLFEILAEERVGEHRYIQVVPTSPETLAEALAPRILKPYFDRAAAEQRVIRAARELELFTGVSLTPDATPVVAAVDEELRAVLPASWSGDRPQALDVQRSEFGEIVAAEVLSSLFGTRIPASRIAHKETPDQQARGADVMGWEGEQPTLVLVLTEVKGSASAKSPPQVVADMEAKLRRLLTDRRALLQELIWLRDHSDAANLQESNTACVSFLMRAPVFTALLAPVLIRHQPVAQPSDPGPFRTAAETFGAPIRFVSVLLPDDLYEFAADVYALAGARAA